MVMVVCGQVENRTAAIRCGTMNSDTPSWHLSLGINMSSERCQLGVSEFIVPHRIAAVRFSTCPQTTITMIQLSMNLLASLGNRDAADPLLMGFRWQIIVILEVGV